MKRQNLFLKFSACFLLAIMLSIVLWTPALGQGLKAKNQKLRLRYKSAREQYLKEVNWWKSAHKQFLGARKKYSKFKNAGNRANYEKQARLFLERTINVIIKRLESLKTWISNRKALSDAERTKIVEEINQDISQLQAEKTGIENATPAQIKKKAKEIRIYWKKHRLYVKEVVAKIWISRLNWVIQRFENVSTKISQRIDQLKASGKDTSQLERWLSDFNQKINLAKEKEQQAKEKYRGITNLKQANQFLREIRQFIKEANNYLRQAHLDLVKIAREIKGENKATSTSAK